ncbi:hypothetical protein Tco_1333422, partial [Tanacetum coccineum]
TLRIYSIHPKNQILGDPKSVVQTRSKVQQQSGGHALLSYVQEHQRNNHIDQQHCLFACFLSQEEPKKISEALTDESWARNPSTNSKKKEYLTELQNLKSQEKEASPNGISEDALDILAFQKDLDAIAQKHLGAALENKTTSTPSVNTGKFDASQHADSDDSDMPELTIFNKPQKGIFDEASYDDEGMIHDFNNLPTEVAQHSGAHALEEPKKISEALQDDSWVKAMQEELLQFRLQ